MASLRVAAAAVAAAGLASLAAADLSVAGCSLSTDLSGFSGSPPAEADAGASADGAVPSLDGAVAPDAAYAAAVLADSPIAYYPLEESSGTLAKDVIGGKNGTWSGNTALGVPAIIGAGALFDGASSRLEMPAGSFGFAGKLPYTIELWVNPTVVDTHVRFLLHHGARSGPSSGYKIYFTLDYFLCSRSDGDGGADGWGKVAPLAAGRFAHIVMTYDGTSKVQLFANGASMGPDNAVLAIPSVADGQLVFGDSEVGQTFKMAGVIDEIAIYDKALPVERILAHYAARPK